MSTANNPLDEDVLAKEVVHATADKWLNDNYLLYTVYTIKRRALISDDGMKPVNRRILYTLMTKNIGPKSPFLKAARAAAETGTFHPHGDSSSADALAFMAQPFNLRVPLIDAYGSVGFVAGDTAAAPRYWECRLSAPAWELVKEVKENAADMTMNYDGTTPEPIQLPIRWPNALINGSDGIAVAYRASLPPHNPTEVINAARAFIKKPSMSIDELVSIMPGPDFPTGGEVFGSDGIREYYETGRGKFVIRGRYHVEDLPRGKKRITFYELPYSISASSIMERVKKGQDTGEEFSQIAYMADLTDKKNGLRLVFDTKSGANVTTVVNELFKKTNAEISYTTIARVLANGYDSPQLLGVREIIAGFIELRKECNTRKFNHRLSKISDRITQLDAMLAVLVDIDKAVSIIRNSTNADRARTALKKEFEIDAVQADYILAMQLRRLTKSDSLAISKERKELERESKTLNGILNDERKMLAYIDGELEEVADIIGDPRRTVVHDMSMEDFSAGAQAVAEDAQAPVETHPVHVTMFTNGTMIAGSEPFVYSNRVKKLKHTPVAQRLVVNSDDNVVIIGSDGIGRRIPVSYISTSTAVSSQTAGATLPNNVRCVGIAKAHSDNDREGIALFTRNGVVKIAKTDFPQRGNDFPVIKLTNADGDEVVSALWYDATYDDATFVMGSSDGSVLRFPTTSVNPSGSKSGGVKGMNVKKDARLIYGGVITDDSSVATVTNDSIKVTSATEIPVKSRGGMGVNVHKFRKADREVSSMIAGVQIVVTESSSHALTDVPLATPRGSSGTMSAGEMTVGVS